MHTVCGVWGERITSLITALYCFGNSILVKLTCLFVCMYVIHTMYVWMNVCMGVCMYVCMYVPTYVCMHVLMYVCMRWNFSIYFQKCASYFALGKDDNFCQLKCPFF